MLAPSKEHDDEKWLENGSHRMMSNGKKKEKKSHRCWSRFPDINGRGDGYFPFCVLRPTLRIPRMKCVYRKVTTASALTD